MARKFKMTWFPPRQCWYGKKDGRRHYCPIKCRGKTTDWDGYSNSLAWWEEKAKELDNALQVVSSSFPPLEKDDRKLIKQLMTSESRTEEDATLMALGWKGEAADLARFGPTEVSRWLAMERERQTASIPKDRTMEAVVKKFLDFKVSQAITGMKSAGRAINLVTYLKQFKSFVGADRPITDITSIERSTWDCVQVKLGEKIYKSHKLTFAGELIKCGYCGGVVTGEAVLKKQTGKIYTYYRCSNYKRMQGHPNVRLTEKEIDAQVVDLYRSIRQPDEVRDMFLDALRDWSNDEDEKSQQNTDDVQRQLTLLNQQQEQLLNLRLLQEIDADTFSRKSVELRDRTGKLKAQLKSGDGDRGEQASLAAKVFELSQALEQKWVEADYPEKRQMLDLVCLNFSLDDVSLVAEMRKPFNMLAEGPLVSSSRGDKI